MHDCTWKRNTRHGNGKRESQCLVRPNILLWRRNEWNWKWISRVATTENISKCFNFKFPVSRSAGDYQTNKLFDCQLLKDRFDIVSYIWLGQLLLRLLLSYLLASSRASGDNQMFIVRVFEHLTTDCWLCILRRHADCFASVARQKSIRNSSEWRKSPLIDFKFLTPNREQQLHVQLALLMHRSRETNENCYTFYCFHLRSRIQMI